MEHNVIRHIASIIADLVIDQKANQVRALFLSYPSRCLPWLTILVNNELNADMQVRFVDYLSDLADGA